MKKNIMFILFTGILLLSYRSTHCTTSYRELIIMGCGAITMATGFSVLPERTDSALDNISKYLTSLALLSSGFGSIVLSKELDYCYQTLFNKLRQTLAGY